jgi:hypothetical protein
VAIWGKRSKVSKQDSEQERVEPEDLVLRVAMDYLDDIENGLVPSFHSTVFLQTALVLSSVSSLVSLDAWQARVWELPEPVNDRAAMAAVEAEKINRLLFEKGAINDRVFRNIRQLTGGFVERLKALREAQDDIEMFGRAEKPQYASTLRMRDAIETSMFFKNLASEPQSDDEGNYSGEQFNYFCPHENAEFELWVAFSMEQLSVRYLKYLWTEFEVCGDQSEDFNRAHILGPGWSARIFGLPPCCRGAFESGVSEAHRVLGGEILVTPE